MGIHEVMTAHRRAGTQGSSGDTMATELGPIGQMCPRVNGSARAPTEERAFLAAET